MESTGISPNVKRGLIIGGVCLLLVIIGVLLYLLLNSAKTPSNRDPNALVGQIEGKTQEEIQAELNKIVEDGMFNISINSMMTFESGTAEGDVRVENIPANHMLMSVQIKLDDTGQVVYETGIIEPGYHIQNDKLDVPLAKGVYHATAMFTAYDPDTEARVGQAGAKVTITVNS